MPTLSPEEIANLPDPKDRVKIKKEGKKSNKWLWIGGGLLLLIIVIFTATGRGNGTIDNTALNPEVKSVATKTIIIVSEVIDGDTIRLSDGNKVRILGIDTPETKDPRKPVECFGQEASQKMIELVGGKEVTLIVDKTQDDKDKYGRLLRYVFIKDTDIGAKMIKDGYAFAYTKYPVSKMDQYVSFEKFARENKLGLWSDDTCSGLTEIKEEALPSPSVVPSPTPFIPVAPPKTSSYTCNCSKTCPQMDSCEEAYYQLNTCGCSRRDGDSDGVPCEEICR